MNHTLRKNYYKLETKSDKLAERQKQYNVWPTEAAVGDPTRM